MKFKYVGKKLQGYAEWTGLSEGLLGTQGYASAVSEAMLIRRSSSRVSILKSVASVSYAPQTTIVEL